MSRFAITFQLDLSSNYHAMFYKYVLYKIRLVTKQDLMSNSNKILPEPSPENLNVSFTQLYFIKFINYWLLL